MSHDANKKRTPGRGLGDAGRRTLRFVRDYTEGFDQRELQRLFDRDAGRAFSVLAADHKQGPEPKRGLGRLLYNLRSVFLGISFKLSPARRLLFAAALLCPLLGIFDLDVEIGEHHLFVDAAPFWFLVALAGMTLLFALELVDRLRVRDELEVARQLQRDLLPQQAPPVPGWRIACSSHTANEIGGDYYDFLTLDHRRLALVVGDASGHGIGAGLLMAIANATFKTAVDLDPTPVKVLEQLNRVLVRTGGRRAFMTFFYGVLEIDTGRLRYASAGHPYPLLRRVSGEVIELGRGALPLGLRGEIELQADQAVIAPGDQLVLYSDGLPEAVGGSDDDAFGFARLHAQVAGGGSAEDLHQRILAAVGRHLGNRPLADDQTLVVLSRDG